jgi:hypothetical protein
VDGLENSYEVLLTQLINVITHNELQTSESSGYHLLLIILRCFANCYYEYSPSIILNLHATCLDDLLNSLQCLYFIALLLGLQLITEGSEDGILPDCAWPVLININVFVFIFIKVTLRCILSLRRSWIQALLGWCSLNPIDQWRIEWWLLYLSASKYLQYYAQ